MPQVKIPTPLRRFAGGHALVAVSGDTVEQAMASLVETHPELKRHLYGDDGRLRNFVNIYLDGEDVRYLERENTPVGSEATLLIVPSIAGGSLRTPAFCHLPGGP